MSKEFTIGFDDSEIKEAMAAKVKPMINMSLKGSCPWCRKDVPPGTIQELYERTKATAFKVECPACKKDVLVKVIVVPVFDLSKTERDVAIEEAAKVVDELKEAERKVATLKKKRKELSEKIGDIE